MNAYPEDQVTITFRCDRELHENLFKLAGEIQRMKGERVSVSQLIRKAVEELIQGGSFD